LIKSGVNIETQFRNVINIGNLLRTCAIRRSRWTMCRWHHQPPSTCQRRVQEVKMLTIIKVFLVVFVLHYTFTNCFF